mmetsp:Transcript_111918/g.316264  ORF Transcript_111918/g.316264 Transcript_111918/m.316264 type:complete len:404 (-) Transcript_111918:86-1297(-)
MLPDPTWAYTLKDAEDASRTKYKLKPPPGVQVHAPGDSEGQGEGAGVQPPLFAPQYFVPSDILGIEPSLFAPSIDLAATAAKLHSGNVWVAAPKGHGLLDAVGSSSTPHVVTADAFGGAVSIGVAYSDAPDANCLAAAVAGSAEGLDADGCQDFGSVDDSTKGPELRERKRRQRRRKANAKGRCERGDWDLVPENISAGEAQVDGVSSVCEFMVPATGIVASKWHSSALSAGSVSEDGHVFVKMHAGPRKSHSNGMTLSSLCMLFERNLRVGGVHRYHYQIMEGSVGAADGVGFVLDSRIRRTNIQRMRSIFLNKHGQVCIRNLDSIMKLACSLPKLAEGVSVYVTVDLDHAVACFEMEDPCGKNVGTAELSFASLVSDVPVVGQRSGFFCAIVTGSITVSLH